MEAFESFEHAGFTVEGMAMQVDVNGDPRFDVLDASNDVNRLAEIQAAVSALVGETPIVAVVDSEDGIIAYAIAPFADGIVAALNAAPPDEDVA